MPLSPARARLLLPFCCLALNRRSLSLPACEMGLVFGHLEDVAWVWEHVLPQGGVALPRAGSTSWPPAPQGTQRAGLTVGQNQMR